MISSPKGMNLFGCVATLKRNCFHDVGIKWFGNCCWVLNAYRKGNMRHGASWSPTGAPRPFGNKTSMRAQPSTTLPLFPATEWATPTREHAPPPQGSPNTPAKAKPTGGTGEVTKFASTKPPLFQPTRKDPRATLRVPGQVSLT